MNCELDPLPERQRAVLLAIAKGLNGQSSAESIAQRLGYMPPRTGMLAVISTLRRMVSGDVYRGALVLRLPPRDRWSPATWCITAEGRKAIGQQS